MVSQRMSSSGAAWTMRFSASTPAWWPTVRGRPRRFAQRPLPSMTIATCSPAGLPAPWPGAPEVGVFCWAAMGVAEVLGCWRASGPRGSDVHDLLFFGFQGFGHAPDRLIGELLDVGLAPPLLVLAAHMGLRGGAQVLVGVAADVAHGDPLLLGVFAGDLHQLLAALLGQRRDRDAQVLAVGHR